MDSKNQYVKTSETVINKPIIQTTCHKKEWIDTQCPQNPKNKPSQVKTSHSSIINQSQSQALQKATDKITQAQSILTPEAASKFIQTCIKQKTPEQAKKILDYLQKYLSFKRQKLSTNPKFRWFKLGIKSRKKMLLLNQVIIDKRSRA
tara:strand:- start:1614 stop:2057 length:444 start_codon:yes stop_codon:yes gene_type:complete